METKVIQFDNGFVKIMHDTCATNPREFSNIGELYITSRNYYECDEIGLDKAWNDFECEQDFRSYVERKFDAIVLPVYRYAHSDVAYNTTGFSCPWDSGQCGYIIARKEKVRKEFSVKRITKKLREQIEGTLRAEVEEFSNWANGNVYGFEVTDRSGKELGSCYGFYGDDFENNGLLSEAKGYL